MLISWPESTIGTREYQSIDLSKNPTVQAYDERLLELFRAEKRMREGTKNELDPVPLRLSKQAKKAWVLFYNDVEKKLKDGSKYAQIRGFGAKISEHALRLAGILNVVENLNAGFITQRSIECGIELAKFYLDETLRISHETTEDADLLIAEELLAWIQLRGDSPFYLSQVYQYGPSRIRNAKLAARTIGVLENHGWIAPTGPMKLDGSTRKETWALRSFGDEQ